MKFEIQIDSVKIDLFAPNSKDLLTIIHEYAQKNFQSENIDFLKAVHALKDKPKLADLEKIYNTFIKKGSPKELGLEDKDCQAIEVAIKAGNAAEAVKLINKAAELALNRVESDDIPIAQEAGKKKFKAAVDKAVKKPKIEKKDKIEQIKAVVEAQIVPVELADTKEKFYQEMESVLSAPLKRLFDKFEKEQNPKKLAELERKIIDTKNIAYAIANLALEAKLAQTGSPEKALLAKEKYLKALRLFIEQEKADLKLSKDSMQEIDAFDKNLKGMEARLETEKIAAQKIRKNLGLTKGGLFACFDYWKEKNKSTKQATPKQGGPSESVLTKRPFKPG